jgi:hypothetical protein
MYVFSVVYLYLYYLKEKDYFQHKKSSLFIFFYLLVSFAIQNQTELFYLDCIFFLAYVLVIHVCISTLYLYE